MNYFKFHSVGQGLFYTGHILEESFNFVYDCGTMNKQKYLLERIDSLEIKEIDFIVISHLDKDHVSGLYKLVQNFKVNKIYLPYFGNYNNLYLLMLANSIFIDVNRDIESKRKLYNIISNQLIEEKSSIEIDTEVVFLGKDENSNNTFEYIKNKKYKDIWSFHLINNILNTTDITLINNQLNQYLSSNGFSSLTEIVDESNWNLIRKIYDDIIGTKKVNGKATQKSKYHFANITLLHYPTPLVDSDEECANKSYEHILSLLTGDMQYTNFTENKIIDIINQELKCHNKHIKFQVPHHGSIKEWEDMTNSFRGSFDDYIISFGLGNRYKHPRINVIDEINFKFKKPIRVVNQVNSYCYRIQFHPAKVDLIKLILV